MMCLIIVLETRLNFSSRGMYTTLACTQHANAIMGMNIMFHVIVKSK